jgi:hypothetical protein
MKGRHGPMWNKRTEGYLRYVERLWGDAVGDTPAAILAGAESCGSTDSPPS